MIEINSFLKYTYIYIRPNYCLSYKNNEKISQLLEYTVEILEYFRVLFLTKTINSYIKSIFFYKSSSLINVSSSKN